MPDEPIDYAMQAVLSAKAALIWAQKGEYRLAELYRQAASAHLERVRESVLAPS
jgi:hypothetical protein